MKYLLDTNACIHVLNRRGGAVERQLARLTADDVAICSVVKAELLYGAGKSARPEANAQKLDRFWTAFESLPFDDLAASTYASIRAALERAGRPIGANDLLIAATALAHGLTVVTADVGEFSRVPGLSVENWEAEPP